MPRLDLVCYCFSITEAEISSAVAAGARTLGALRKELGVSTCCGGCEYRVRECLMDAQGMLPPGAPQAAAYLSAKSPITNP